MSKPKRSILELLVQDHINGATFIAIDTETEPTLTGGKNNPFKGRVKKIMSGANVMIFQNKTKSSYATLVNKRLKEEGKDPDFVPGPRQWGTRRIGEPFVDHKDEIYLEVIFLKSGIAHYTVDGKVTAPETIEGLKLDKQEGDQGGLDNSVIIRTFNIKNIKGIKIGGDYFDLEELESNPF